jgi:GT2 family glycosyltransferase
LSRRDKKQQAPSAVSDHEETTFGVRGPEPQSSGERVFGVGGPAGGEAAEGGAEGALISKALFDEESYLNLNPDVRIAISRGVCASGYAHYLAYGRFERRPLPHAPSERVRAAPMAAEAGRQFAVPAPTPARCAVETLLVAPNAGLMVVGWIDDVSDPIARIRIVCADWHANVDASCLVRVRRMDVEDELGNHAVHHFGFLGVLHFEDRRSSPGPVRVEVCQHSGKVTALQRVAATVTDVELRALALSQLATAAFFGNSAIESMGYLERGVGAELVKLNRSITRHAMMAPFVERFGRHTEALRGTIIVCLYGKPEFYFLQNCLYAGLPGIEDYEFIYVSNSPELAETLLREAHSASLIYGLRNSVMILADNAGFGGANNAAAQIAGSGHLLMVNPDVFPRDLQWAAKHTAVLDVSSREQTRLFGVPLYYDDGSLMHGGMYFEVDVGVTLANGAPRGQKIYRVEHFGKGAPPDSPQFTRARPVPAVTGAFFSVDRSWFEELGGFSEDFVFGHYEDADFCLRSIDKGVAPWLHDIRMYHLEGKGSTRQLAHDGGSMVNRWLFSRNWMHAIETGLRGPSPSHRLFSAAGSSMFATPISEAGKTKAGRRKVHR